jgi:sec-independent protein translocase protein TatA
MNFFGIGLPEMILIMVVALLIFGPKKLPEIGRSVGKAIKGFQDASNDFQAEFKREADLLEQVKAMPNSIMNPMLSGDSNLSFGNLESVKEPKIEMSAEGDLASSLDEPKEDIPENYGSASSELNENPTELSSKTADSMIETADQTAT